MSCSSTNNLIMRASQTNKTSAALVLQPEQPTPLSFVPPIVSSYNDKIRPLLDAVDKLRDLEVTKEGIELPTIVVVGDQSSGKSSVLESLAGISLPRGQDICTRVPLIMQLQHHSSPVPELSLKYSGKVEHTDEENISEAIINATNAIAGGGAGISNTPLTLIVKKNGVPDLTMVDLPGITRVPVRDQPKDIYDQIKDMIMSYIESKESIVLNVLSATVDFTTCESIRMSQIVDPNGERTLAVVTKADMAPEGLLEKVTADDVNIGLGYVCVRNRVGDETYEEAMAISDQLFRNHSRLSQIDKSMVGIPVLAQKLVQIQAASIARNLPEIVKKINDKLKSCLSEFNTMPRNLSSVADAMTAFMQIIGASKESLKKLLVRGEFDEAEGKSMHCTARLVEMLNQYSDELRKCSQSDPLNANFLMEEIKILEEAKGIKLPNFVSRNAFLVILQRKVNKLSHVPIEFLEKVWTYIEDVLIAVVMKNSENYYQLQLSTKRACHNLIAKMKEKSIKWMGEVVEMEKLTDYTCNPEYVSECNRLMASLGGFIHGVLKDVNKPPRFVVVNIGMVEVEVHRQYSEGLLTEAFDLKMRMMAYWKVVLGRLVDFMALHLQLSVANLVNKGMEKEIISEVMGPNYGGGGGIERMLEESPSVALKREKLLKSIKKLKDSKEVVSKIMDGITG